MYYLTDNIVAGPAGSTYAGPAGHTEAGPAGSFTPAPAGQVTPAPAGHTTPAPAGHATPAPGGRGIDPPPGGHAVPAPGTYVPIDTSAARVPVATANGGWVQHLYSGSSANVPGAGSTLPAGIGGGGVGGVGGGAPGGVGGGGGASPGAAGAGSVGAAGGGGVAGAGAGGGFAGGVTPIQAGSVPVVNAVGGPSPNTGGPGFAPVEVHMGHAVPPAAIAMPSFPSTEGFMVPLGGHSVIGRSGQVQLPPGLRFHGPRNSHVAHHPMHVDTRVVHAEAYQFYKPVGPTYEVPRIIFPDERPHTMLMVDQGGSGPRSYSETNIHNASFDFSQSKTTDFSLAFNESTQASYDLSTSRAVSQSFPESHSTTVNVDMSSHGNVDLSTNEQRTSQTTVNQVSSPTTVNEENRVVNMLFVDGGGSVPTLLMGGLVARVG